MLRLRLERLILTFGQYPSVASEEIPKRRGDTLGRGSSIRITLTTRILEFWHLDDVEKGKIASTRGGDRSRQLSSKRALP